MKFVEYEYIIYWYEMYDVEISRIHQNTVTFFKKTTKVGRKVTILFISMLSGDTCLKSRLEYSQTENGKHPNTHSLTQQNSRQYLRLHQCNRRSRRTRSTIVKQDDCLPIAKSTKDPLLIAPSRLRAGATSDKPDKSNPCWLEKESDTDCTTSRHTRKRLVEQLNCRVEEPTGQPNENIAYYKSMDKKKKR